MKIRNLMEFTVKTPSYIALYSLWGQQQNANLAKLLFLFYGVRLKFHVSINSNSSNYSQF